MTAKIYMQLVQEEEGDTVLVNTSPNHQIFSGNERNESLACGSCKNVFARHVSVSTFYQRYVAPKRLILRCLCGASNLIPTRAPR